MASDKLSYCLVIIIACGVIFGIVGAVLMGLGQLDFDAEVANTQVMAVCGVIFTGIGIVLSALASW
jgi:hypothetical protein